MCNKGEALHDLRASLMIANKGQVRRKRGEELVNQASCLNLVTNAVIVWNTVYMAEAVAQLKREGYPVNESDLPHIWPSWYEHINIYGRYHFQPRGGTETAGPTTVAAIEQHNSLATKIVPFLLESHVCVRQRADGPEKRQTEKWLRQDPRRIIKRRSVRPSVSAPSEAWRFLWGGSPHRVRSNQPPVPRVASGEEAVEPNEPGEAYTGNHVDRRGDRTSQSLIQPRKGNNADGDGFNAPEAYTEEACW